MPYRCWHSVSDGLVDGIRYKSVIESLPHMDSTFDGRDVESPAPIEEFSVANQPVGTVCEAFCARLGEGGFDIRSKQDLAVVVVDGFPQLLGKACAEVFGGDA